MLAAEGMAVKLYFCWLLLEALLFPSISPHFTCDDHLKRGEKVAVVGL